MYRVERHGVAVARKDITSHSPKYNICTCKPKEIQEIRSKGVKKERNRNRTFWLDLNIQNSELAEKRISYFYIYFLESICESLLTFVRN